MSDVAKITCYAKVLTLSQAKIKLMSILKLGKFGQMEQRAICGHFDIYLLSQIMERWLCLAKTEEHRKRWAHASENLNNVVQRLGDPTEQLDWMQSSLDVNYITTISRSAVDRVSGVAELKCYARALTVSQAKIEVMSMLKAWKFGQLEEKAVCGHFDIYLLSQIMYRWLCLAKWELELFAIEHRNRWVHAGERLDYVVQRLEVQTEQFDNFGDTHESENLDNVVQDKVISEPMLDTQPAVTRSLQEDDQLSQKVYLDFPEAKKDLTCDLIRPNNYTRLSRFVIFQCRVRESWRVIRRGPKGYGSFQRVRSCPV